MIDDLETKPNPALQPFLDMAARIARNESNEFGGAMLIVPPSGDPVALLLITPTPSEEEALFWAQCKSKLDITAADRLEKLSGHNLYGGRR